MRLSRDLGSGMRVALPSLICSFTAQSAMPAPALAVMSALQPGEGERARGAPCFYLFVHSLIYSLWQNTHNIELIIFKCTVPRH